MERDPITGHLLPGNHNGPAFRSGNPNIRTVQALKREFVQNVDPARLKELIDRNFELIHSEDGRVALAAIELLYNRIFGKAKETIDVEINNGPRLNPADYSDEQLNQVLAILERPQAQTTDYIEIPPRPQKIDYAQILERPHDVQPLCDGVDLILPEPRQPTVDLEAPPMPTEDPS